MRPPANDFDEALASHCLILRRARPAVLQLNVGKLCNLTCVHCHVNAGPTRREIIESRTVDRILEWFERTDIPTLDLTGGVGYAFGESDLDLPPVFDDVAGVGSTPPALAVHYQKLKFIVGFAFTI